MADNINPIQTDGNKSFNQLTGEAYSERLNSKGINVKALHIKQLELEYHNLIDEIRITQNIKSVADAIRFALKRATGRI